MSEKFGIKVGNTSSGRALARALGRGAIWTALGLLLVRGVGAVLSPAGTESPAAPAASPASEAAADAFAVGFARTYLANPSPEALAPYLAEGARVPTGTAPQAKTAQVAQAEVSASEDLGGGEAVLTVACELRDSRTLYLTVPIVRSGAGEVAALGAPSIVAAPGTAAGAEVGRPQPLAGDEAPEIDSLVSKFLPIYISSTKSGDLSYLLAPGTVIEPLGAAVALKAIGEVNQLGDGEGPRRVVLAAARVTDPGGGGTYPLVYRLGVERGGADGRWYVAALEGVSA